MVMTRFSPAAILAGAVLALAGLSLPAHADYSHARIVRLSLVEGDAQVYRPETGHWEQALVNLPIQQGYRVATKQGRAEIEFESGATARIAEDTALQFPELALANGGRITRLELVQGTATFYANLSRHDRFLVAAPHLEVAVPNNARFRLDVLKTGTEVRVLKGDVTVDALDASHRLTKGQTLAFREDSPEPLNIARNAEPDAWDRWVADRGELVSSASNTSLRYMSAPFSYGLADLSSYGNWFYDPFYGYVWQPWGITSAWLPYWDGRWVFFPGFGLTWVSYEPWGWLPYHYGRWVLAPNGWVWIPGGFGQWQPGLVGWVQFGDQIGWYPLGPHDRLGVVPPKPQIGTVVLNTPAGVIGGAPNRRLQLTGNEGVWLFPKAPTQTAAFTTQTARALSATAGAPPSIAFERGRGKFVNNPETLLRPAAENRRGPAPPAPRTGASPSASRSAPASRGGPSPRPASPARAPRSESRGRPH